LCLTILIITWEFVVNNNNDKIKQKLIIKNDDINFINIYSAIVKEIILYLLQVQYLSMIIEIIAVT